MKTTNSNSVAASIIKQILYAFQVIIIALAIPLLYYIGITHKEGQDQYSKEKGATKEIVAYKVINK